MIDQSPAATSDTTSSAQPAPNKPPLTRPRSTMSDHDTQHVTGISLAAVLGGTLLGVNCAQHGRGN